MAQTVVKQDLVHTHALACSVRSSRTRINTDYTGHPHRNLELTAAENVYASRHSLPEGDGIMRTTDAMIAGKKVGKCCAQSMNAQGAMESTTEADPICALQPRMKGIEVAKGDIITKHMTNVIMGNTYHSDNELHMKAIRSCPASSRPPIS